MDLAGAKALVRLNGGEGLAQFGNCLFRFGGGLLETLVDVHLGDGGGGELGYSPGGGE